MKRALVFVLILLFAGVALADMGPKPTMNFSFQMEGSLKAESGTLYQCKDAQGSEAKPLAEVGPQRFKVEPDSAFAMAYGFAPYQRLEIVFSDGKTRRSNVFKSLGMKSKYKVLVKGDKLVVSPLKN